MSLLLVVSLTVGAPAPLERRRPAPPADDTDVSLIEKRDFEFPVLMRDEVRVNLLHIELHVCQDGKNWQFATLVPSHQTTRGYTMLPFSAPRDGLYLFQVRLVYKNGSAEPPDPSKVPPSQKLRVRAK